MAQNMLAGKPLSRNEICKLADILEEVFDSYLKNPLFIDDYLKVLRTLIGLGFTAVLADRMLLPIYQHYLHAFMQQDAGHFKENEGAKRYIAQCTSEMVGTALICFSALKYPGYYRDFSKALSDAMPRIRISKHAEHREAILSHLKVLD